MQTAKLKKFAQFARRSLQEQVYAKLKLVLAENSEARREHAVATKKLDEAIRDHGKEHVIERVAYIWFNRFCALRFMDVNRYTSMGVVSPAEGQFQPEILADAKMGHIDDEMVHDKVRQQIFALLDGKAPSRDPQGEAYRLLLVAACNFWNKAMPFLFQRIDDYTELLMPDDLLSGNSILAYTREAMTPDSCEDVEVIGWLYQFYISEKKDQVFEGLKENKKITPENIPAATQLFTPHWIVRYLVENSLGRLWLLNRPHSRIFEKMKDRGEDCYYIKPDQIDTDFLRIGKPEEIRICDPACGSGHMLTYAFDLLYAIYEEEGYESADIPEKILTNNLYGIEIDERAGELAAFALTMKARAKHRRFFNKSVNPNICVLENVLFDGNELQDYMEFVGRDLFTAPLQTILSQFEEANNFGSLIRPDVTDIDGMLRILESKNVSGQLFISMTNKKVLKALRQAEYLSTKYHVVIANPPYMGASGMNPRLKAWVGQNYPDSKADFMTCFMERCSTLTLKLGFWGMINLPSWMFLSTFENFRSRLLTINRFTSLLHLGRGIFGSDFGSVAFSIQNSSPIQGRSAIYRRLFTRHVEVRTPKEIESLFLDTSIGRYEIEQDKLVSIPGNPIAYWASENQRLAFSNYEALGAWAAVKQGLATADNNRFLRLWHEISNDKFGLNISSTDDTRGHEAKWFPYNKGGEYRRWYGNFEYVVNWENDGFEIRNFADAKGKIRSRAQNTEYYFQEGVTWTFVSSGSFGVRFAPKGSIFDVAGSSAFPGEKYSKKLTAFLASKVTSEFLALINPTLNFQVGNIASLPIDKDILDKVSLKLPSDLISNTKTDWDSFETSWDFTSQPLLNPDYRQPTLEATYQKLRAHWHGITLEMQRLEEENNRIFIQAYGLKDELDEEVDLCEITLTCNPRYRYANDKKDEELESLLLADTMRELISYAVGCMFGRYALDKSGLILANQGETIEDYVRQIPQPSFPADNDNVIPMLDRDWFTDDIAERFRKFLRVAFGDEHYETNLKFVEKALGKNGKSGDIRDYFIKDFYSDHVKRYKKRPIYWLFSSPKGSFNALIYMHRYRPDTVSVVLNNYLREFRIKLASQKNHLEAVSISGSEPSTEKAKALKDIDKISKMIVELEDYEREVLYPLATRQVEINLDDGVMVNYPKFGNALRKIPGLEAVNEE